MEAGLERQVGIKVLIHIVFRRIVLRRNVFRRNDNNRPATAEYANRARSFSSGAVGRYGIYFRPAGTEPPALRWLGLFFLVTFNIRRSRIFHSARSAEFHPRYARLFTRAQREFHCFATGRREALPPPYGIFSVRLRRTHLTALRAVYRVPLSRHISNFAEGEIYRARDASISSAPRAPN